MFSNRYIFIYTAVMVAAVAVLLALASTLLRPMQQRNEETATMQELLKAAGKNVDRSAAIDLYNRTVTAEWRVNREGDVVAVYDNDRGSWKQTRGKADIKRAFDSDLKEEMEKAAAHEADAAAPDGFFPVFVCNGGETYIVPLQGKGLWGAIWGYIALGKDFNTIEGATFSHKGETPGLGAEIASEPFQRHFIGKKLFDENGNFTSITVQKGGAEKYPGDVSHAVDAVSGGTITSNGVTAMLEDCLSCYVPFFRKRQSLAARPAAADTVEISHPVENR